MDDSSALPRELDFITRSVDADQDYSEALNGSIRSSMTQYGALVLPKMARETLLLISGLGSMMGYCSPTQDITTFWKA